MTAILIQCSNVVGVTAGLVMWCTVREGFAVLREHFCYYRPAKAFPQFGKPLSYESTNEVVLVLFRLHLVIPGRFRNHVAATALAESKAGLSRR